MAKLKQHVSKTREENETEKKYSKKVSTTSAFIHQIVQGSSSSAPPKKKPVNRRTTLGAVVSSSVEARNDNHLEVEESDDRIESLSTVDISQVTKPNVSSRSREKKEQVSCPEDEESDEIDNDYDEENDDGGKEISVPTSTLSTSSPSIDEGQVTILPVSELSTLSNCISPSASRSSPTKPSTESPTRSPLRSDSESDLHDQRRVVMSSELRDNGSDSSSSRGKSLTMSAVESVSSSKSSHISVNLQPLVSNDPSAKPKQELLIAILSRQIAKLPDLIREVTETAGTINYREGKDGYTLLHRCTSQGCDIEVLTILLNHGLDVNAQDARGNTALHFVTRLADAKAIQLLLEHGVSNAIANSEKKTSIHIAARIGNAICLDLLLQHIKSSDTLDAVDSSGSTALHYATRYLFKDCVKLLLSKGARPNVKNAEGKMPIELLNFDSPSVIEKKLALIFKKAMKKSNHLSAPMKKTRSSSSPSSPFPSSSSSSSSSTSSSSSITSKSAGQHQFSSNPITSSVDDGSGDRTKGAIPISSAALNGRLSITHVSATTPRTFQKLNRYGFVVRQGEAESSSLGEKKMEMKMESKWIQILKNPSVIKKNWQKITKYCDRGIPAAVRGRVWVCIADLQGLKQEKNASYSDFLNVEKEIQPEVYNQILKDLHRTMPNHAFFKSDTGQRSLHNILIAFAAMFPDIGYIQGMGFITALFLIFLPEEDAFWMLVRMALTFKFSGIWMPGIPMLSTCFHVMECLLKSHLPRIHDHFERNSFVPPLYVTQFFITGFLYSLPFTVALRIWDSLLVRDFDFLYAVTISILKIYQDRILHMGQEELFTFFKFDNEMDRELIPHFNATEIINTAISLKIKSSEIKEYEEEHQLLKKYDKKLDKAQLKKLIKADMRMEKKRDRLAKREQRKMEKLAKKSPSGGGGGGSSDTTHQTSQESVSSTVEASETDSDEASTIDDVSVST